MPASLYINSRSSVHDYSKLESRAAQSLGISNTAIYQMVADALREKRLGGLIVDAGCGVGNLWNFVHSNFKEYVGVDAVQYREFPAGAKFIQADLNINQVPLRENSADVAVAVEVIEHLENPRAFMRELARIIKPGGLIIITTPNQLSLLSLLSLLIKRQFVAFQDVHYPAHITALLETDLKRIALECGLVDLKIAYSLQGRIVLTPWSYPKFLSKLFPRALSDNLLLLGKKP
ncbi:MAG: hypothetical protein AUG51_10435 [Acidobacteria bacterium 13_1_20CM_3_53_8]|nr:MAG: hypothetical protein AUG51_10435 [Acidobacteria bacterium 13_1_20CM_3_53_8]